MKRGAIRIIVLLCAACLLTATGAPAQTAPPRPPRLAVLGFLTEKEQQAEALARLNERLHAELEQLALFHCLPLTAVAAARSAFPGDSLAEEQEVPKIGRALGVQVVAVGRLQKTGMAYALEIRLVHVASGLTVGSVREDFFGTLVELAQHMPILVHRLLGVTTAAPGPCNLACAHSTAQIGMFTLRTHSTASCDSTSRMRFTT
ncbi:MAG: hypothetical protein ONB48_15280 [candidate division KSB1 bacterium]|nr:hypothetical protein [candidate division KSB1 bacterium]MDZ7273400.1 hypothetical protein [candidate division KSB1 bacterium]MDZ7287007.1 hypothetical protein [candidate division KSB1 bacterium]MDZ7299640.1 hypothetical protein [candidate division KSB1 bacterium]MDZ7307210.1 hypothetical protein [candidate division KSB1 bacterium]